MGPKTFFNKIIKHPSPVPFFAMHRTRVAKTAKTIIEYIDLAKMANGDVMQRRKSILDKNDDAMQHHNAD
jgi:hypothetical protein